MKYQRVKGGEKNLKSGKQWSKDEIIEVYHLFKKINGVGIHEHNLEIQRLAENLGRTVRSTEAQLLMFRNLEKGGEYSHGNMSILSKIVWEEMEKMNNNTLKAFPIGLLDWAGHKKGGVKKPFDKNSGRPNGKVIQTKLTKKLDEWVEAEHQTRPKIILLVGGPGNGKTDSLEHLIARIDEKHKSNYREQILEKLESYGGIIPRAIEVDLGDAFEEDKLVIVQDASTGEGDYSSQDCLIQDLEKALKGDMIYIACINRGILAESVTKSKSFSPEVYDVLNTIIAGITENINHRRLWPMDENDPYLKKIGVWPMDVESLVKPMDEVEETPAFQIITSAVDEKKWNCESCSINKDLCPFYQNKKTLQNNEKLVGLLKILYDFEIISNKRWTFRELFSLTSYMIVGSEHEFGNEGPCNWAMKKNDEIYNGDIKIKIRTIWELNDHLYHFRLFNIWPTFASITKSTNNEVKLVFEHAELTNEFFGYFTYKRTKKIYKPDITSILDGHFYKMMDPGQLSNEDVSDLTQNIKLKDIESNFSYSVSSGFEKYKNFLNPLESRLFEQLIDIERELDREFRFETSISSSRIDKILLVIRMAAVRLFKRILFCGLGISKDELYLKEFRKLNPSDDFSNNKLKKVRQLFESLIQDTKGLTIIVNSSIAQPNFSEEAQVKLTVPRIQIKPMYVINELKDVPRPELRVFSIKFGEMLYIQLSYQLYKALRKLDQGVKPASMPLEVLAMIDSIKSKIAGNLVRDESLLINAKIKIGISKLSYRIDDLENTVEITTQNIE
jgi:hypothetical protein